MRLLTLSMIASIALAAPACAGTEEGNTANPFTEPSAGQTTTSGLANTGDASARQPGAEGGQDVDQQPAQGNEGNSGGFYQEQKKDTDGH